MTREEWLNAALINIRAYLMDKADIDVPMTTKVSCGLAGGRIGSKRIGECWNTVCSADGFTEIFISPVLADVTGASGVLATLVHEAIHAAVGVAVGHRKPFQKAALAVGLTGKMTATVAGPSLMPIIAAWSITLGSYPHAAMSTVGRKKQSTRLIKVECGACGYTLRTTQKWIDKAGAPICTCNDEQMRVDGADDGSDE